MYTCTGFCIHTHLHVYTHLSCKHRCAAEIPSDAEDDAELIPVGMLTPRMAVRKEILMRRLVHAWMLKGLPDVTDMPVLTAAMMRFWTKVRKSKDRRKKPHPILDALCAQYTNSSCDFALKMNEWCVQFEDKHGNKVDLVARAMITVWLKYCSLMAGHPMPESNACQMVLKYLTLNRSKFVKCFHNRLYYYSSGSIFASLVDKSLKQWLLDEGEEGHTALRKLIDHNGLYSIVGDIIISYMVKKRQVFPNATLSKQDFWLIPMFKRGMVFVFLVRFALGYNSHRKWSNFTVTDYKLNVRCFKRWKQHEKLVMAQSVAFNNMPDVCTDVKKKRSKYNASSTSTVSDSPRKRVCIVHDDTTSEED